MEHNDINNKELEESSSDLLTQIIQLSDELDKTSDEWFEKLNTHLSEINKQDSK
jgi:hypothetical protein